MQIAGVLLIIKHFISVPAAEERTGALPTLPESVLGGAAHGASEGRHFRGARLHILRHRPGGHSGYPLGGEDSRRRHLRGVRRSIPTGPHPRQSRHLLLRDESEHDRRTHVSIPRGTFVIVRLGTR